jgi:hypothetical protein
MVREEEKIGFGKRLKEVFFWILTIEEERHLVLARLSYN